MQLSPLFYIRWKSVFTVQVKCWSDTFLKEYFFWSCEIPAEEKIVLICNKSSVKFCNVFATELLYLRTLTVRMIERYLSAIKSFFHVCTWFFTQIRNLPLSIFLLFICIYEKTKQLCSYYSNKSLRFSVDYSRRLVLSHFLTLLKLSCNDSAKICNRFS